MKRNTVAVVITAYNEEKMIGDCLESIKNFADEIIVVDNESSDNTVTIAKKYTEKIFSQKNNPLEIDLQKNFGFSKTESNWILSLDADERLTEEVKREIKKLLENESDEKISGYYIARKNSIFNKWIEHAGWYPDYQLRLFKNGKGTYTKKHVHEMVEVEGETEKLTESFLHINYTSVSQFLYKHMLVYAPNEATSLLDSGYTFSYLDIIRFPVKEFLSRYFAREGYKDGLHGLVLSLLMSFYHLAIITYIWEKKGFAEVEDTQLLRNVENEFTHVHKQCTYWFFHEKQNNTKNPFKKTSYKIMQRLKK